MVWVGGQGGLWRRGVTRIVALSTGAVRECVMWGGLKLPFVLERGWEEWSVPVQFSILWALVAPGIPFASGAQASRRLRGRNLF